MIMLAAEECPLSMRCSAHAAKSSKTFCLLCREPAFRQSMPYSPPPLQHMRIKQQMVRASIWEV